MYIRDTTIALNNAVFPICQAVGPTRACAVLLTIITTVARANPVYCEDIKNMMANMYDLVDQMDPMKGGVTH